MIDAIEARNYVNEYMSNYSLDVVCKDINDKIIKLSKKGQSHLCYYTDDIRDGIIDMVIEELRLHGYDVIDNGYSIEINW